MDQPRGNVRARGRARQAREQARRPGEEPERGGAAASPAAVHPQQGNGGRRTHRGAPRSDPVPSQERPPPQVQMQGVTEAMAAASLADYPSGRGRSREGLFGNDNTCPKHITDKTGTSGEPIQLYTNYFKLIQKPNWCVYQYHCDFAPVVESSRLRRAFIREHKETFGSCYLFDGMSDLKTISQLGESLELFSKRLTDGENIRITMKRVNELAPTHPELQRLYNTQMRNNLRHLKFQQLGRHLFDPEAINEVPQYNLQIWAGVITSIRQHEKDVMMCVDTIHKVVRKETALQIIRNLSNRGSNFKEDVSRELVGSIVMTRYNNKTYRIEDIDWSLNPTKTFDMKGVPTRYIDYYQKQYEVRIADPGQPLLLATSKEKEIARGASVSKKVYLVPEICLMTGITDAMRSNFTTMRELGNHTRVAPDKRVQNLNRFIKRVNTNESVRTEMNAWGMKFSDGLVGLTGRIVPCETIFMNQQKKMVPRDKDFTMLVRSDPMHAVVNLQDWLVVCTRYDRDKTNEMLSVLCSVANKLGMRIQKPTLFEIKDDRINTYFSAFRDNYRPGSTQMVMFILPNNKKERYDALKKYTYVDNAVPSQVIVSRTISKPKGLMTVATKVAIQLNCKLGGVPWALAIPIKATVMICGYDTYHDSSRKGRSAGAFVASLNQSCTRWYSKVSFHAAGGWQELSNHMKFNFTAALRKYHEINNALPEIIIVYRDGVGDGQIRYVREWEIQQLSSVINENFQGKSVRFGFIVVNKKINTRFFRTHQNTISNPPHGTVIDHTVTRCDRYDFFLVSQMATQGTVSPTMYNVIEDSTGLKPEYIQRLSYKLTHLYFNCTATISVPAPCQYAHKLAFLAGQSLHQEPKEELCDRLFYL